MPKPKLTETQVKRVSAAAGAVQAALNDLASELTEIGWPTNQVMGYYESIDDLATRVEREWLRPHCKERR